MGIQGFSEFPRARQVLEDGLTEKVFPGVVAGIWSRRDPDVFHFGWGGERRLALKGFSALPMERETVFDLASVTKVFGTAALAMVLVERGWIEWTTPVRTILPEFRHAEISLRELAAHTSGLPAWAPFFEKLREIFATDELERIEVEERQRVLRELVFSLDLDRRPGTEAIYSDVGFMVLGFCLEAVTGLPLDHAIERFVWRPMGLFAEGVGTGPFFVRTVDPAFRVRREDVAATEDCPWRHSILQGQVHDDNCWASGGYAGHAGAFGTAENLLRFGKRLLEGFVARDVLREAWSPVGIPEGCTRTLGWDTPSGDAPAFGRRFSPRSVGHVGFTGTSIWIDPVSEVVVTLLTNRVHPNRHPTAIRAFRGRFHDALAEDFFARKPG